MDITKLKQYITNEKRVYNYNHKLSKNLVRKAEAENAHEDGTKQSGVEFLKWLMEK